MVGEGELERGCERVGGLDTARGGVRVSVRPSGRRRDRLEACKKRQQAVFTYFAAPLQACIEGKVNTTNREGQKENAPVQALLESLTLDRASLVDAPLPILESVKTQSFRNLRRCHRIWLILWTERA